jgi:hypothetical protein
MKYTYTNQEQIRRAFWEAFPNADRRKITSYDGKGKMYCTDTRCAFVDFVDALERDGQISQKLSERVTLSRGKS